MTSHRIQRLLDDRDLEERPAPDDEVAGYWRKAMRSWRDSLVPGLSPQGSFNAAYEAALDAAMALVRETGYRVLSRSRHHWAAFYAVQGLGDAELEARGAELDASRSDRHQNVYEPDDDGGAAADRRDELRCVLRRFLPAAHERLLARRPALRGSLENPPEE